MSGWKRVLTHAAALAVGLAITSSFASAYYFWMFIGTGSGVPLPLPGRFDLAALTNNTVPFFISNQAPVGLVADDTQTAVYSQIRRAAEVWNGVGTSALRLGFGGVADTTVAQTAPGIDVVFDDDMPPGILAQSKPTFPADLTFLSAKETTFVPILRSRLQLRANLATVGLSQASHSDSFHLTLVHEFGHAIGLQHSMTSAVMSTSITRATKKGSALAADDVAAISSLYPGSGYGRVQANVTGSITGHVTLAGHGVNLASVVALSLNGTAVGAMTNPDGSYRIDGIPAGSYFVYAHPLPPKQTGEGSPANIIAPTSLAGDNLPANTGIDTRFFPGTKDWTKAGEVAVVAGKSTEKIDFAMSARTGPVIYNMETYGYRVEAMAAPPLKSETNGSPIVFKAAGATASQFIGIPQVAPGLSVGVIGGAAQVRANSLRYYADGFLLMYVDTGKVSSPTPVALAVTQGDELYILPAAFTVVPNAAPEVTLVASATTEDGVEVATISGSGLEPGSTQILFDGVPASLRAVNEDGSWVVTPPVGPSGLRSTVEAVNPDGQTSILGLPSAGRAVYGLTHRDDAALAVSLGDLVVGTDFALAVTGTNTHFSEGRTVVGFGNSDVSIKRLWVVSPELLVMNVSVRPSVGPNVAPGPLTLTVATDLEILTVLDTLRLVPASPEQISLRAPVTNAITGLAGVPVGGIGLVRTSGLPSDLTGWSVIVGGIAAAFAVDPDGVLSVTIPDGLALGVQPIQLTQPDGRASLPIAVQVDAPPPAILLAVVNTMLVGKVTPVPVSAGSPARANDLVVLSVAQLNGASDVWIDLNASIYRPLSVGAPDTDGVSLVTFALPAVLPFDPKAAQQTVGVMIGTGTRLSPRYTLHTRVDPPAAK